VSILELSLPEIRSFRWKKISMIFQSAMNVLDPVMRIQDQFIETFEAHSIKGNYGEKINHFLELAGLGSNVRRMYPHELSGGMKQRVCIALALSCEPELLIADEPTTALDVVVQKEVLLELNKLKRNLNLSIIFITHDLRVAASVADRIGIFYAGRIVELGPRNRIIANPRHPYSKLLLSSIITTNTERGKKLATLSGSPPDLSQNIVGCSFYERCPVRMDSCRTYNLERITVEPDHFVECLRAHEELDVTSASINPNGVQ
jgi:peptide/nickel transport system ATP-binding protein